MADSACSGIKFQSAPEAVGQVARSENEQTKQVYIDRQDSHSTVDNPPAFVPTSASQKSKESIPGNTDEQQLEGVGTFRGLPHETRG